MCDRVSKAHGKKMAHTSRERGRPVGWQLFTLGTPSRGLACSSVLAVCASNVILFEVRPEYLAPAIRCSENCVSRTTTVPELFLNCRLRSRAPEAHSKWRRRFNTILHGAYRQQRLVQPARSGSAAVGLYSAHRPAFPMLLRSALPSASSASPPYAPPEKSTGAWAPSI